MATFDFSEKLPFGEMFLVRSSEIEGRIDPLYYQTIHNFIFAKCGEVFIFALSG